MAWFHALQGGRWANVTNHDACVTCHTSVTDFRPKSGNPMEVTLVTSPKLYIVSHAKGTTSLSFNINLDTTSLSFLCLRQTRCRRDNNPPHESFVESRSQARMSYHNCP